MLNTEILFDIKSLYIFRCLLYSDFHNVKASIGHPCNLGNVSGGSLTFHTPDVKFSLSGEPEKRWNNSNPLKLINTESIPNYRVHMKKNLLTTSHMNEMLAI